ncbi:hypothetical protein HI914_06357 [Erysiphe necator]|nr:hypothetical protein HI914_06357 [Erysiphe necator]
MVPGVKYAKQLENVLTQDIEHMWTKKRLNMLLIGAILIRGPNLKINLPQCLQSYTWAYKKKNSHL